MGTRDTYAVLMEAIGDGYRAVVRILLSRGRQRQRSQPDGATWCGTLPVWLAALIALLGHWPVSRDPLTPVKMQELPER
jgi:hypothetical protein